MPSPPDPTPPWSIPIREPGPDVPQRSATWIDRVPLLPVVGGGIAVFVLLVVTVVAFGGNGTDPGGDGDGSEVLSATATAPETTAAQTSSTDRSTDPSTTTTSPSTTSSTSTTTTAPTTTTTRPAPEPGDVPIASPGDLGEGWVAQFSSVPSSAGGTALETAFATVVRDVPDAVVLRGSDWPSLRSGYWVIVKPRLASGAAAADACVAAGRVGRDSCFGRYLMQGDGTVLLCWREEDGTLGGDC